MRYRVTSQAAQELDDIFVYWAERASLEAAERLVDGIVDRFWLLGEYPEAGRPSDEAGTGTRCFPAGKYLIYYRANRRGTDILHIFHGARDQREAPKAARTP